MLELRSVSKQVGRDKHLDRVSLSLEPGTVNVLLGPTLSGKTSLMRLMAGLDKPSDGQVLMNGEDVTGVGVRRRNVAMVYQQFINYPALTVYENIASPMRIAGTPRAELDRKVRDAAELLKLTPFLERTPLNLSGGQQQRTALARALVKGAELVLLDEPLANLDYKLREELRVELPRLFAESGAVFVYATTEPHEALLLGGRTATLHEGRVTQFGDTIEVYNRPADLVTARTFADPPLNALPVTKRGAEIFHGDHSLGRAGNPLPDGDYTLAVRAHHVALAPSASHTASLDATVGTSEITGSETYVHVNVAGQGGSTDAHAWVLLAHGVHRLVPGAATTVHLDPDSYYLFDRAGLRVASPLDAVDDAA